MSESPCDVCKGSGKNMFNETCPYCNGTGEWNDVATAYLKNHICQCILLDRVFCPVCELKCHHDSSSSPKQIIDDSFSGLGATTGVVDDTADDIVPQEEEGIVA